MQQGPQVAIAFEDDMTTPSAIASIRTTFGDVLFPAEVSRTCSSVAGLAMHPDVVYKVSCQET